MLSIEEIIEKCREQGMRITSQRIEVIRQFVGNRNHPTVEDIFKAVKAENPDVSRATIYNTINMLIDLGELRVLTPPMESRHYDPDTAPHDHAVCISCGRVFDTAITHKTKRSKKNLGIPFNVIWKETMYHGLCDECAEKTGMVEGKKNVVDKKRKPWRKQWE